MICAVVSLSMDLTPLDCIVLNLVELFYIFPCIKSTGLLSEEFCERLLYSQKDGGSAGMHLEKVGKDMFVYPIPIR